MARLLAVTEQGLALIDGGGRRREIEMLRRGRGLKAVAVHPHDPDLLLTAWRGDGLAMSTDGGRSWIRLELPENDVFSLAISAADGSFYAGTEPSRLFRSADGGESWHELSALQQVPSRPSWSYPPRPWTSHVRSIAPHPDDPQLLLVGIELGGVMLTSDGGGSFEDHRPGAVKDVHSLAWHPLHVDRAFEAGGGGAAWSDDRGRSWQPADEGRDRHYCWALAVHPTDSSLWFVSASVGPSFAHSGHDVRAAIYRRRGEESWAELHEGLPREYSGFPYALLFSGDALYSGLGDGRLFLSNDSGESFSELKLEGESLAGLAHLVAWQP